jgi:hypothetical protein
LFSCLSTLCLQLLPHGSYLSFAKVFFPPHFHHYVTFPPEYWLPFFKRLPSPSRSRGMAC